MAEWTPERRADQAARLQELKANLTPEQVERQRRGIRAAWTPERRAAQGARLRALRLAKPEWRLTKVRGHRGGKNGWTPERREAQRTRLAAVRLVGEGLRAMARHRESVKRAHETRSKATRASWTPERRRQQSARSMAQRAADPLLALQSGQSLSLWHAQRKEASA